MNIPVPQYPPFKLRSSLIDKDPVIWVHLLEGYIQLCQLLAENELELNVKLQQQLQLFLRGFLRETSEEHRQIFSLGQINPDIKKNTALLRTYVFTMVKQHSVVKLGLTGEACWHFVLVYVEKNAATVRSLIDGTFKLPLNDNRKLSNISLIQPIQKHIVSEITHGKFSETDLTHLVLLLGQHLAPKKKKQTVNLGGGTVLAKDKERAGLSLQFAEKWVSPDWIEQLESLYAGGRSVHAETVKNVMVVSVLSLLVAKVASLVSGMGIHNGASLSLCPLLASIIISDGYNSLNPGLPDRLTFLQSLTVAEDVLQKDIDFLVDMFPKLTPGKATTVLREHGGDAEKVTLVLLDDPGAIERIAEPPAEISVNSETGKPTISEKELQLGLQRFHENETHTKLTKKQKSVSAEEMKKRTLSAALTLLYEDDEDERDDTYDDQEHTAGEAFQEYEQKPKNKDKARLVVYDDDQTPQEPVETRGAAYKTEINLFGYFKTSGAECFDRSARKSATRADMKNVTKMSDEQIEGWMRMLLKSPKRFRLLEEQYAAEFSNRRIQKQKEEKPKREPSKGDRKKVNARNEKNKGSRANHNRKAGHGKKARAEMAGMQ